MLNEGCRPLAEVPGILLVEIDLVLRAANPEPLRLVPRMYARRFAPVTQPSVGRFFPFLRECSMTASGPGNTRLVWPSSKRTRYGGSPPVPRTSTISPIRSDWPTMWPRTRNRSPAAACIRPPPHPRSGAARATEDSPSWAHCHDKYASRCRYLVPAPVRAPPFHGRRGRARGPVRLPFAPASAAKRLTKWHCGRCQRPSRRRRALAGHVPDHFRKPGGTDDHCRYVQFRQRPPSPGGHSVGRASLRRPSPRSARSVRVRRTRSHKPALNDTTRRARPDGRVPISPGERSGAGFAC